MTSLAAASHRLPELLCCRQGTPNTLLGVGIALRDTLSQPASQPASRPGPGCLVLVGSIWAIRVTRPSRRPMWAPRKIDALRPRGLASDSDVSVHGQSSCHEGGGRCVSLGPSPSRRKVVGGRSHGWPDVVAGGSQACGRCPSLQTPPVRVRASRAGYCQCLLWPPGRPSGQAPIKHACCASVLYEF